MITAIHYALPVPCASIQTACGQRLQKRDRWTTAAAHVSCPGCLRSSGYAARLSAYGLGRLGDAPVPEHKIRKKLIRTGAAFKQYLKPIYLEGR